MANNIQVYSQMANDTAAQITGSFQEWTAFLTTAARLYKYPYPEQLMIYAQRPDATACASYDLWNKRMGRYVRRGSSGIALIDMTGDNPKIRYVFDVADTGRTEKSRRFHLWEYKSEHADAVSAMLERRYDVTGEHGIEEQFERVAAQLADEYWNDHKWDILGIVEDSFLEGYDEFNVGVAFRNAATVSITYSLLSRCGLEPEEYFEHEDFLSVFDWNTPAAVTELGTAISSINQEVLRQIEITVKQYEREHSAERTMQYEKQPELQPERGLPDPRPDLEPAAGPEPRQVREDAEEISARTPAGPVQSPAAVGEAASAPAGNRPDSAPALGADDTRTGENSGRDGGIESQRPDEMGGPDEHLQGAGGRNSPERADFQLTPPVNGEQLSLFPTEAQQIQSIAEAESVQSAPFAFSIPQTDIDQILRFGSNTEHSRMRVAAEFMKQKSRSEMTAFLQKEYHGGYGIKGTDGDVSAWYAGDGIHLSMGLGARYVPYAQVISWEDAAARIEELLDAGAFATNVELIETPGYERRQMAQSLWYMKHDMSVEAEAQGFMPTLTSLRGVGFPEETDNLTAMLEDAANVDTLLSELGSFAEAHAQNRDLMRFPHYKPAVVLEQLRELTLPRREYTSELSDLAQPESFITEDEIAQTLAGGSSVEGGKGRIYAFFTGNHTLKEQADFLKEEYGTGGGNSAISGNFHSWRDYSSKGIVLRKPDCVDVQISWNNVAKRISALIREDRYLTPEEKARLARIAQERAGLDSAPAPAPEQPAAEEKIPPFVNDYNTVKAAHSDDIVLYQVGDFFEMFGEDAKQAAELLDIHLTTRPIAGAGRVDMCGVPSHTLEQYIEKLRDKYDVTISAVDAETGGRNVYSLPSVDHEAERAIDAGEAEFGADGTRVFRDVEQSAAEETPAAETAPPAEELTDLQKKAIEIAKGYEHLPMQEKVDMIARTFGYTSGKLETSPCYGKWRGTSDMFIRFDSGVTLGVGNERTPRAKSAKVQNEYVNALLIRYNPEIVVATKEAALAPLREREAKDNEIAAQKGLKPYTLLNVELNDGADDNSSGYIGWYYVTLAVDGKICTHLETGLNHDIAYGKAGEPSKREHYFIAGALNEDEVDYVFNNVGFSSTSDMYSLPMSRDVLERAEKVMVERSAERESAAPVEPEQPQPTIRELYERYKPVVIAAVSEDTPYRNACGHSDRENAKIECNAAVRRAVLNSHDMQLLKLFSDMPEFRSRLHQEVFEDTYPQLHEHLRPLSQDDIDDALRAWNGDISSKRAVAQYMAEHARDRDTAAWLAHEYGSEGESRIIVRAGSPASVELPWAKVQRRIAQLIREDSFFTEQEKGTQTMAPRYQVVVYHHFENGFDEKLEYQTPQEAERIAQGYVDGTMEDDGFAYDGAAVYDLQEKQYVRILGNFPLQESPERDMDSIAHEVRIDFAYQGFHFEPTGVLGENFDANETVRHTVSNNELGMSVYAGAKRPYTHADFYEAAGNTKADVFRCLETGKLYLPGSNELFEYTGTFEPYQEQANGPVQETATPEAAPTAEEYRDTDNEDFHAADLTMTDLDLRDVLTGEGGLLYQDEKEVVSSWFRAGESNTRIAKLLSEMTAGRTETMVLETREQADYFASANGIEIEILDNGQNKSASVAASWDKVAPILRALYVQELNGFTHEPVSHAPEERIFEETPTQEDAPPELPPQVRAEPVTVYPAEQNHLPYDVVIETLPFDEPEQQLRPENFRITDDNLGVGGAKTKFRMNMEAITLLKELEFYGRQATPEEQEILSRYVGWGGLADAFDESKPNWANEFKELYAALTPEEYAAARASTLNAHYTSPTVIKAIYEAVGNMGFQSGNILEPSMGVGNFFGLLPDNMAGSKLYGVELDSITGRIAKQLYPQANITVAGFETTDRKDFFDLAIGNVPFGDYQVNDRAYNKLGFSIHNYFFAKALDQVRPGGVVAFVTSRYTLDAKDPTVRKYLAQRAELLGAIRLPNNAFRDNAGTEVVSDIIFLQKRDRPIEIEPDWVHLGENDDGFAINSYFIDHPEMILGRQSSESTQYGRQDFTVEPIEGLELRDQLHDAVKYIHGTYEAAELPDLGEEETISNSIPADPDVKNYSYTIVDGEVYYRENSIMVKPDLNATAIERVKGMIGLRDCMQKLIGQQMDGFISDSAIQATQVELNRLYDSFTAKYGIINSRANSLAFSDDSSYFLLCSLEELDEDKNLKRKADMFTKRTIKPHEVVTSVDTAVEALALSIGERGKVDMAYMCQLTGMSEQQIFSDLKGVIFLNPQYGYGDADEEQYLTADEYLSGDVREKLEWARRSAKLYPDDYTANVEALEKVQPKDLDASEIDVRLGATWLDPAYIQQFMEETFNTPFYQRNKIQVRYAEYTGEWNISNKGAVGYGNIEANMTYGTERANAYKILEDTLNLRDVRIYDIKIDADGKEKRVLNSKETTLAQQKQQAIKDAFQEWIWKDPERRQAIVQKYNELFNSSRPREYDGQHIIFSGMNPEIRLREHQLNAVAHILYGGNTLLAHEVGAGKTFEMVAAAMESKRLGLCSKSLFVVPNHLTEQWASEFLRLYPSANILVASKKDFEPHNRKKFCARIATGDYDAVIIGHSQFERIPVSRERQERLLREQIREITNGIRELKFAKDESFSVKQMEKTKKNLEAKLEKLQASDRKDDVVTFEQLGVDRLYVDEAHSYKNLFLYTKMRNVAGLSTSDAQKSSDMLMKCRYLDELTGGKGVVFATGTPVSNSMTELYTMMRYLQHDMLKRKNLTHFDCWASTFGETTTAIELAPEGTGYRARTRFARFHNLPELMCLFKEAADIKTADQLDLPRPKAVYHNEVAQPTEIQKSMVQELSKRAAAVHAGLVDASTDNMLKITSDGRKLGLDQRIINPDLPDDPSSKVNLCVNNIVKIWEDGQADKLTQLVFCDLSTPKAQSKTADRSGSKTPDSAELHALLNAVDKDTPEDAPVFTVYDDIRAKLIARGIPAEQIAFIHDSNTPAKKKELFAKVRAGQVRVLMGSTFMMGAGMNVQDRLIALHDLDAPWRPGDLEQRSGRIIRQGNMNPEVHIYRYVTEATFDAYLWQTLENKQKFISQIMTSKSPVRSCDDVDETALSYAEIKALCAGDERIKEKMDLDIDVARLKLMRASHQSQQYRLEDKLLKTFPKQIDQDKTFIAGFERDMQTVKDHPHPADGFAGMTVRGDVLTDKENAGAALLDAFKEVKGLEPVPVGSYRGFEMSLTLEDFGKQYILTLKGAMSHRVELGKDARGNLTRIDNVLGNIENRRRVTQEHLENLYTQVESAKAELGKPFPQEEEYKIKSARLAELNAELNIDDKTPMEALAESEPIVAKQPRQSILAKLKAPLPPPTQNSKTKEKEERS